MLRMGHFGEMLFDDVELRKIAEEFGTPTYVYSLTAVERKVDSLNLAFQASGLKHDIHYAIKANYNSSIVSLLHSKYCGVDVVSAGEITLALNAGVEPQYMVFSGVGKTREELTFAIDLGVGCIFLESYEEAQLLEDILRTMGNPDVNVGIRYNPDVEAETHSKISTGARYHKFGVDEETAIMIFALLKDVPRLKLNSLSIHIGSQLYSLDGLRRAFVQLRRVMVLLEDRGMDVQTLNLGGGLGVSYGNPGEPEVISPEDYARCIVSVFGKDKEIILEPGRYLVSEAGVLITRVVRIKNSRPQDFVVIDAGMNDLMRPALYDAYHEIRPTVTRDNFHHHCDIVGPVCETGDIMAKGRYLKTCKEGDLLVIKNAGAYGYAMANCYNGRSLPAEVIVKGGDYEMVNARRKPDGGKISRLVS